MRFFWKPTPGVRFEDDDEERDVVVHVVVSIHLTFCIFVSPRCVAYFLRLSLSLWYRCSSASLLGTRVGFEERKNCEGATRLIVLLSVFYVRVLTMPSIFHELQCYIITSLSLSIVSKFLRTS